MTIKTNKINIKSIRMNQIRQGAMEVFKEKSFHAATMRDIAKASQVSLGNIYNFIEKKEDILNFIWKDLLKQVKQIYKDAHAYHKDPPKHLEQIIRRCFSLACRLKKETLLILTEAKSLNKKKLLFFLAEESKIVNSIEKVIKTGISMQLFQCSNPHLMANIIAYNLWIVPLRGWNVRKICYDKEIEDNIVFLFLNYLMMSKNSYKTKDKSK